MILTQDFTTRSEDFPSADQEPNTLSSIQETLDAPNLERLNDTLDSNAPAEIENPVNIVNEVANKSKHQSKRKVEDTTDQEVPNSKPSKKRKNDTTGSDTYNKVQPQVVKGKLSRPTRSRVVYNDNRSKGEDVFEIQVAFPENDDILGRKNSQIGSSAEPTPIIHSNAKQATSSSRKQPGKRGRPPGKPKLQENAVNEGPIHTRVNQKADRVTPSAVNPKRELPSPKTRSAKSTAVSVNPQARDEKADEQPDYQKEGTNSGNDNDHSSGGEDVPANRIIDIGKHGNVPQQIPEHNSPAPKAKRIISSTINSNSKSGKEAAGGHSISDRHASNNDSPSGSQDLPTDGTTNSREHDPVPSHSPQRKSLPRKAKGAKTPSVSTKPAIEDGDGDVDVDVDEQLNDDDKVIDKDYSPRRQDLPTNGAIDRENIQHDSSQALENGNQDDAEQPSTKNSQGSEHVSRATKDSVGVDPMESSPEGDSESTENDLEPDLHDSDLVLFGQQEGWMKILAAAKRTTDASRSIGKGKKNKLELKSQYIGDLIERIETALRSYGSLASEATVSVEMMDQHRRRIRRIRKEIDDLPSGFILGKREERCVERRLVRDIYAYGVPNMVNLLRKALETQSPVIARKDNITALEEIISIQHALFTLCERARDSKIQPKTGKPIIQPTKTIRSYLKAVLAAFEAELDERKRQIEKSREKYARDRREWEEISQKCAGLPGYSRFARQPRSEERSKYRHTKAPALNQWSKEQDSELLAELLAEEHGELPGKLLTVLSSLVWY